MACGGNLSETLSQIAFESAMIAEMRAHVLTCLPEEACGLLGGQMDGGRATVNVVIPVENTLHSPVRFRMDPREQLRAFNRLEVLGLELVGIFHSHPTGPDAPSATDLAEFYYPGVAFLIWSPGGEGWQMRAFRITGEGVAKAVFPLSILAGNS